MAVTASEKAVLRELAKKYAEIAGDDKQRECVGRMRDTNNLKIDSL